jgi:hypothetical protein
VLRTTSHTSMIAAASFAMATLSNSTGWADNLYTKTSETALAGKVISIDSNSEVLFDVGCSGNRRRFNSDQYFRIDYNNSCSKVIRIDPVGGPETGCPPNDEGTIGAKRYIPVTTTDNKDWALKSAHFSGDNLYGRLLISDRSVVFPRSYLREYYSYSFDCFFRNIENK